MMQDKNVVNVSKKPKKKEFKSSDKKHSLASPEPSNKSVQHHQPSEEHKQLLIPKNNKQDKQDNKNESDTETLTDNEQPHYGAPDNKYQSISNHTPQHSLSNFETEQKEQEKHPQALEPERLSLLKRCQTWIKKPKIKEQKANQITLLGYSQIERLSEKDPTPTQQTLIARTLTVQPKNDLLVVYWLIDDEFKTKSIPKKQVKSIWKKLNSPDFNPTNVRLMTAIAIAYGCIPTEEEMTIVLKKK